MRRTNEYMAHLDFRILVTEDDVFGFTIHVDGRAQSSTNSGTFIQTDNHLGGETVTTAVTAAFQRWLLMELLRLGVAKPMDMKAPTSEDVRARLLK